MIMVVAASPAPMNSALCVAERHASPDTAPTNRPPAAPSIRLCVACHEGFTRDLAALPALLRALRAALVPRVRGGRGGRSKSAHRRADQPAPIDLGVAELRDQIRHDVGWWSAYVAEARGLSGPSDPAAAARWLARHADWMAANPQAAEHAPPAIAELVRRARAVIDPDSRRVTLGPHTGCPAADLDDPPGSLVATVATPGSNRPSTVRCDRCGLVATPRDWAALGAASATATAADLASAYGTTIGYVYKVASVDRWRRTKRGGVTRYAVADAAQSFASAVATDPHVLRETPLVREPYGGDCA